MGVESVNAVGSHATAGLPAGRLQPQEDPEEAVHLQITPEQLTPHAIHIKYYHAIMAGVIWVHIFVNAEVTWMAALLMKHPQMPPSHPPAPPFPLHGHHLQLKDTHRVC